MPLVTFRQKIVAGIPILFFLGSFSALFAAHISFHLRSPENGLAQAKEANSTSFNTEPVAVEGKTGSDEGDISSEKQAFRDAVDEKSAERVTQTYPVHTGISTTFFWIGEEASDDNKDISNSPSAWDDHWKKHFGGTDDPKKRDGYFPSKFTPKENPFYVALPYNDFDKKGKWKADAQKIIPWASEASVSDDESYCKNRWVKIMKGGKTVYAQWEDVGPFGEDDSAYVFGTSAPKSKTNKHAGLDVSPAVRDFLGLKDVDTTDWVFVDEKDVPDGPWKRVVTDSNVFWK